MNTQPWTPPPGTAGLIFDCDGTLADTMPAHYKAWLAMLGPFNIPFPEPRFYAMGGMPTGSIIRVLAADAGVTVSDVDAMVLEKEALFLTHLDAVTRIEPVIAIATAYRGKLPMVQLQLRERWLAAAPGQPHHREAEERLPGRLR